MPAPVVATVPQQGTFSTPPSPAMCSHKVAVDYLTVLTRFGMNDCNSTKVPMDPGTKLDADKQGERIDATEYRRIIGRLRYLLHTRPHLSFVDNPPAGVHCRRRRTSPP